MQCVTVLKRALQWVIQKCGPQKCSSGVLRKVANFWNLTSTQAGMYPSSYSIWCLRVSWSCCVQGWPLDLALELAPCSPFPEAGRSILPVAQAQDFRVLWPPLLPPTKHTCYPDTPLLPCHHTQRSHHHHRLVASAAATILVLSFSSASVSLDALDVTAGGLLGKTEFRTYTTSLSNSVQRQAPPVLIGPGT